MTYSTNAIICDAIILDTNALRTNMYDLSKLDQSINALSILSKKHNYEVIIPEVVRHEIHRQRTESEFQRLKKQNPQGNEVLINQAAITTQKQIKKVFRLLDAKVPKLKFKHLETSLNNRLLKKGMFVSSESKKHIMDSMILEASLEYIKNKEFRNKYVISSDDTLIKTADNLGFKTFEKLPFFLDSISTDDTWSKIANKIKRKSKKIESEFKSLPHSYELIAEVESFLESHIYTVQIDECRRVKDMLYIEDLKSEMYDFTFKIHNPIKDILFGWVELDFSIEARLFKEDEENLPEWECDPSYPVDITVFGNIHAKINLVGYEVEIDEYRVNNIYSIINNEINEDIF